MGSFVFLLAAALIPAPQAAGAGVGVAPGPASEGWRHANLELAVPLELAAAADRVVDVALPFAADEALLSWNVRVPATAGFTAEVAIERADGWSAFLFVGDCGRPTPATGRRTADEDAGVRVAVDVLRAERPFEALRVRLSTRAAASDAVRVERLALTVSRRPRATDGGRVATASASPGARAIERLGVPFRSQRVDDPALADSICSPAAVAMVLAFRGVDVPLARLCDDVADPHHGIWGNWPRSVQAAFEHGVGGRVARFEGWPALEAELAAGRPVVCSIAAPTGLLAGAPYPDTTGHLLVVEGLTPERVLVVDPADGPDGDGRFAYERDAFARAWLPRGGTVYLFDGSPK